jgi:hypothetical protein
MDRSIGTFQILGGGGVRRRAKNVLTLAVSRQPEMAVCRAVARTLIGGGCIFIYSCYARRISFVSKLISKEISWAEHEYMNMHPSTVKILIALSEVINSCTATYSNRYETMLSLTIVQGRSPSIHS